MLVDVIEAGIVGRDIVLAASCSGFDRCKKACLRQRKVGGFPEIDDVLEVKSDSFSMML